MGPGFVDSGVFAVHEALQVSMSLPQALAVSIQHPARKDAVNDLDETSIGCND